MQVSGTAANITTYENSNNNNNNNKKRIDFTNKEDEVKKRNKKLTWSMNMIVVGCGDVHANIGVPSFQKRTTPYIRTIRTRRHQKQFTD